VSEAISGNLFAVAETAREGTVFTPPPNETEEVDEELEDEVEEETEETETQAEPKAVAVAIAEPVTKAVAIAEAVHDDGDGSGTITMTAASEERVNAARQVGIRDLSACLFLSASRFIRVRSLSACVLCQNVCFVNMVACSFGTAGQGNTVAYLLQVTN
jgi:hypothetical protein